MRKNPNNVEQLITTNCRRDLLGVNEISLFCSNWFFQGSCFYESCFSILSSLHLNLLSLRKHVHLKPCFPSF